MQADYTHMTVILDRTGSMASIRDDVIGGYNAFLAQQQAQPGKATLTLVQFDSQDPYEVLQNFAPLQEARPLTTETYIPRASTPLLDALGRGIMDLERALHALPDDAQPEQVMLVVITDGQENASREFSKAQVMQMIHQKQQAQHWQFVFLSADLAAIGDALASGVHATHAMGFDKTTQGTQAAWQSISNRTADYRAKRAHDMSFTQEDRRLQQIEQQRGPQPDPHVQFSHRPLLMELLQQGEIRLERSPIFDVQPAPLPADFDVARVEGMLLGLAIGDSLGNTTEAQLPHKRQQRYGTIHDYLPNRHAEGRAVGLPSDDTQLAFWLLEQLLADGRLDLDHLAQMYTNRTIYGIGSSMREFIRNYKENQLPWQQAGVDSAGNGALMRIAPILVPYLRQPSPDLYVDAALAAMVTHNNRGSTAACVAFVAMLWDLLGMEHAPAPTWWIERYVEVARPLEGEHTRFKSRDSRPHAPYRDYVGPLWRFVQETGSQAWRAGTPVLDACNGWCSGAYLLETVPSVLYLLMHYAQDPEEAIVRAVNDTYDNDTCAALVGAAVGALHGKDALPAHWQARLLGRTTAHDDGRIFDLIEAARVQWG